METTAPNAHPYKGPKQNRLASLATVTVIASVGVWTLSSVIAAKTTQRLTAELDAHHRQQNAVDQLIYFDEVRTMSARVAATTGDRAWESRYRAYGPPLGAVTQQAFTAAAAADRVSAAGRAMTSPDLEGLELAQQRLQMIEQAAFAQVRQADLGAAQGLLFSDRYKSAKEAYRSGLREWASQLGRQQRAIRRQHRQTLTRVNLASAVTLWGIAIAWFALLGKIQRDIRRRQVTEHKLRWAKNQLEASHSELRVSKAALQQKAATLEEMHDEIQVSKAALQQKAATLEETLGELQQAQLQMVQSEKMSSLGQLAAGIAHEINNPVNFVYANLEPLSDYTSDLLHVIELYQTRLPRLDAETQAAVEQADLDFVRSDLPKILASMEIGTERIRQIVLSLNNFSRLDEEGLKPSDIHEGLESALLILQHRLKESADYGEINIERIYHDLPEVNCYPSQLNQVFMNILTNAVDALEEVCAQTGDRERGKIRISTRLFQTQQHEDWVEVAIADNGIGIPPETGDRIFDAFFTTKPVGKGTGIGLSISYAIVTERHEGLIDYTSIPGELTEFTVQLPVQGPARDPSDVSVATASPEVPWPLLTEPATAETPVFEPGPIELIEQVSMAPVPVEPHSVEPHSVEPIPVELEPALELAELAPTLALDIEPVAQTPDGEGPTDETAVAEATTVRPSPH